MKLKSAALLLPAAMLLSLLTACGSDKDPAPPVLPVLLTATYLPVGPQVSVPATTATSGGWTACHTTTYDTNTSVLSTVLANCNGARLMLACRPVGSVNFTLLAQAPRADVTFVTPNDATTVHNANGSGWYYSTTYSLGFIRQGDVVNKGSCDFDTTGANDQRLCWHTGGGNITGGYRCGINDNLNGDATWERVVLHAN